MRLRGSLCVLVGPESRGGAWGGVPGGVPYRLAWEFLLVSARPVRLPTPTRASASWCRGIVRGGERGLQLPPF